MPVIRQARLDARPSGPQRTTGRALAGRCLAGVERLVAALTDPRRRDHAFLALLVVYVGVWTLYGVLAKGSQDLHHDMAELVAWSRELALGNYKHPTFSAVVVWVWFAIFPTADWAFYLLGVTAAAGALWITWRLAGDFLDPEKRLLAVALLTLVPFYNLHALKFNVNVLQIPVWAATTFWFLRSYRNRDLFSAALAGVSAGLAMFTKYWAIFLLASLALAALSDPRRREYFRSWAPYVSVAAALLTFGPHLIWLGTHDFVTLRYPLATHPAGSAEAVALSVFNYVIGAAAYVAVPVMLTLWVARPSWPVIREMLAPSQPDRRLMAVAFLAALALPCVVAPFAGGELTPLWTMPAWTLLPVLLLSAPGVSVTRGGMSSTISLAIAFPLAMLLAAPAIALAIHVLGRVPPFETQERLLARQAEQLWQQTSDRPLRLVGGHPWLASMVTFYAEGRPSTVAAIEGARRSAEERIRRDGVVIVCFAAEIYCTADAAARAGATPGARQVERELSRSFFGVPGPRERYVIAAIPPLDASGH